MTSTADVERNLAIAETLIGEAAARGGRPSPRCPRTSRPAQRRRAGSGRSPDGPWVTRMAEAARRHRVAVLLGSIPERIAGDTRVHNTSILLGADGAPIAIYRKIHLFDIDLPGMEHLRNRARCARETLSRPTSRCRTAGRCASASICYDLRFPELYRALVKAGAQVLAVPPRSRPDGKDHWEVLRAPGPSRTSPTCRSRPGRRPREGRPARPRARRRPWGGDGEVADGQGLAWRSWTSTGRFASAASCRPSTTSAWADGWPQGPGLSGDKG